MNRSVSVRILDQDQDKEKMKALLESFVNVGLFHDFSICLFVVVDLVLRGERD